MTFFKSHQKLHIWLLADLGLLAAFWIAREHRDWMNALERFVRDSKLLEIGEGTNEILRMLIGGTILAQK